MSPELFVTTLADVSINQQPYNQYFTFSKIFLKKNWTLYNKNIIFAVHKIEL